MVGAATMSVTLLGLHEPAFTVMELKIFNNAPCHKGIECQNLVLQRDYAVLAPSIFRLQPLLNSRDFIQG